MILDTTTGEVTYSVNGKTATSTFNSVNGMTKINSISLQSMNQGVYIGETWWDNIEVKEYVAPVKVTKYTEDFESATLDTLEADGAFFDNTKDNWEIVGETGRGKVLHAKAGTSFLTIKDSALANVDASDKVRIAFDFKQPTNGSTAQFRLNGQNNTIMWMHYEAVKDGNGTVIGNYDSYGKWNHVELILDAAKGEVSYTITNADGVLKTDGATKTFSFLKNTTSISQFFLGSWVQNGDGETYWDNIEIERYYPQPKVKSVEFYAEDVKLTGTTDVAVAANKIVIDFGAKMDEASIKDEITVTGCSFTGAVDGEKYVMTLNDALTAGSTYTLTISKDAKSEHEKTLGTEYTLSFAANAGESKFAFGGVEQNSAAVTSFANLTKGAKAKVSYTYTNTTGKKADAKLIFAYYNGSKLVKCEIVDASVAANEYGGTKSPEFTVDSASDATELNIMLWSDMENLKPLTGSIEL